MTQELARQLVMRLDSPTGADSSVGDAADVAVTTRTLGHGPVTWATELGRRSFDLVVGAIPDGEREQVPILELQRGIEKSALDLLRTLAGEHVPSELNTHQLTIVREMVRQDVPFERIVRGLRRVQRHWTDVFLELVEHRPRRERTPLLRTVLQVITAFSDAAVDAVIAEYLVERQRLLAQRLTDRREMVTSIIAGENISADVAQRTLGIDLDQHHVAFVLWLGESPRSLGVHGELERVAGRAARELHCPGVLTVPRDDATAWVWVSRSRPFEGDHVGAFSFVHDELGHVRAAVGDPCRGLAGFRRSHLTARDAHRIAISDGSAAAITAYRDVSLVALLSADTERARWFVADELGELAADDPGTAELRLTLLSYLDAGGSLVSTASALRRHRNTIIHRLRRVEQLLGYPITQRRQHLHAALQLAARLGPLMLPR